MAGIASWFSWESKEQRKKKEAKYRRKMFPFGDAQKDWEIDTINQLWPKRRDNKTIHFELLVLREALYDSDNPDPDEDEDNLMSRSEVLTQWENRKRLDATLKKEDEALIKSMALLELESDSMEHMPTLEQIKAYVRTEKN